MRLLFTGGGGAATEALYRLLRRHEAHFADADRHAKPYWLPRDRWHVIPRATAPGFLEALKALCLELQVDALIPGVDEELLRIALFRTMGEFACEVLLPPQQFVATHLDKLASMKALQAAGIPVPKTDRLVKRLDISGFGHSGCLNYAPSLSYPCVLKPREGRGSRHVRVVRSDAELDAHVALSGLTRPSFLVQEYLDGQEYTVTLVADKRRMLRAVVPVRVDLKRGITVRAETEADDAVIDACRQIHAAQPVSGIYNVQCIKTADGSVKPFEINPRVSTTTCLAMAAGVDVIGLALDEGGLVPFTPKLTLRRSWITEFA